MEISEEKKLEILLAQLQERYQAMHNMRDRSMQFVIWIVGFGLGMAWILIDETILTIAQRISITLFLFFIAIAILVFVGDIHRGFKVNRHVTIKIETALKLYEKNFYNMNETILPEEYSYKNKGKVGHFRTLYLVIIIVFLLLTLLTWLNPCKSKTVNVSEQNQNQIIENK